MSDVHLFIRYGLAGVGMLAFFVAGLAIHGPWPRDLFTGMTTGGGIFVASMLPLVGIAVQGLYIIWLCLTRDFFADDAREIVHKAVLEALNTRERTTKPEQLERVVRDSTFVWFYYTDAPVHLIDWARRRRSYHYLGVELAIASVIGIALGLMYPLIRGIPVTWAGTAIVMFILLATVVWNVAAVYLATLMKHNVDDMELIWANARLSRDFKGLID